MSSPFYQYPIRVAKLLQSRTPAIRPGQPTLLNEEHPTCSLGRSIAQFLHLLLHTRPGQLRSAATFGCALWDAEFDNTLDLSRWEETMTHSLLAAVQHYEPRLRDVRIHLQISSLAQIKSPPAQLAARWQADISIKGVVVLTHEAFSYATQLYIGQLAS